MASSSRTKKQRSSVRQSKQGTSYLESNPLNMTRILANDEQRKVFEEHFHGHTIFTPKFGNGKQQGFGETVKNRDILSTGYLKLKDRLLHYFQSYVILPKFSNHSQISDIELQLVYAMKYNIKINWVQMIRRQVWNVRNSQSPSPYAIFITKILEHVGVSTAGETRVALNLREIKIDVEFVYKMEFSIDPHDRRTYRHRTNRLAAPTADQP
ncbi:hypothetical protein Lal_00033788 [Lupinus albus]|nr:hypothetical protein Lal_00033788 [Lupinus albus]